MAILGINLLVFGSVLFLVSKDRFGTSTDLALLELLPDFGPVRPRPRRGKQVLFWS